MANNVFGPMQLGNLAEMMDINLGSSATAASNMLDRRVDISTLGVEVVPVEEFKIGDLDPAIGVEIKYTEGLDSKSIMLLRRADVKVILDILMGSEPTTGELELNDLTGSAVSELMKQMMGSAAIAMSDFIGVPVVISSPTPFDIPDLESFRLEHLIEYDDPIVVTRCSLKIEDVLDCEFVSIISVATARTLLQSMGIEEEPAETEEPAPEKESAPTKVTAPAKEPVAAKEPAPAKKPVAEKEPAPAKESVPEKKPTPAKESAPEKESASGTQQPPHNEDASEQPVPPYGYPPQPYGYAPDQAGTYPNGYMPYPPMYYPGYPYPPQQPADPKVIATQAVQMPEMMPGVSLGKEQSQNLELIMEVPLQVSVEIGRTKRKVQEILEFSKGTLVVLDKLAGDQVDLFVNGKCIAKGDVVIIDDNFGVRITEIVQKTGIEALMTKGI